VAALEHFARRAASWDFNNWENRRAAGKARNAAEFEDMSAMFAGLYPDVAIMKGIWRWIDSAQHRLVQHGAHRSLPAVDLQVCATAALRDLVVHDDTDFATVGRCLPA
jgi:predicted nucleic acid-binding protein